MEWVETVAKTLAEAREMALDRLGVGEEDAEFEILEEPKAGLFGRVRGEARVRARVRPTAVRPKQDRRNRNRPGKSDRPATTSSTETVPAALPEDRPPREASSGGSTQRSRHGQRNRSKHQKELATMGSDDEQAEGSAADATPVDPSAVGEAAAAFMTELAAAFGSTATATLSVEGSELDVWIDGEDL